MYILNDYVDALISLLEQEKSEKKRKEIFQSWLKLMKKHHRILEMGKVLKIIENKIQGKESAAVTVASDQEAKILDDFFKFHGVKTEREVDPEVLGGARIIWDNVMIDNTIKTQLSNLKKRLN